MSKESVMADVKRVHVDLPPETQPAEGGPARSHYDFRAEPSDSVSTVQDEDGTWRWQLHGPKRRLKLEAGNFPSSDEALAAARDAHGDVPRYKET